MSALNGQFKKFTVLEWFLLTQPIIDLLTGILHRNFGSIATIGMIIRFVFLASLVFYVVFMVKSPKKRMILVYLITMIAFAMITVMLTLIHKGPSVLFEELKNLTKVFYFPLMFIGIITVLMARKNPINRQVWVINAAVISTFLVVPTLFGLNYLSYNYSKFGSIGWFYSPNEISAILSILMAFVFYETLKEKTQRSRVLYLGAFLIATLVIGTKVPAVAIILMIGLVLFQYGRQLLKKAGSFRFISVMPQFFVFVSVLSLIGFLQFKNVKTQNVPVWDPDDIIVNPGDDGYGDVDPSIALYKSLNPSTIKIINLVFSSRDRYFLALNAVMNESPIDQKLFGLGYTDYDKLYKFSSYNIVEVDLLDVYFGYGFVGLALFLAPLIAALTALYRKRKLIWRDEALRPNLIALVLMMGISMFSGHVLTAPAVSIYVAALIADTLVRSKSTNE